MRPDSNRIKRPASAASANTIQRRSSARRYLPNLWYQAMTVPSCLGRMIEPTAAAVNRLRVRFYLGEGQHAGRIVAKHRLDRRRRNAALVKHWQEVAKHGGIATPAMARQHGPARHVR